MKKYLFLTVLLCVTSFASMATDKPAFKEKGVEFAKLEYRFKTSLEKEIKVDAKTYHVNKTVCGSFCGGKLECLIYEDGEDLQLWVTMMDWEYCP